MESGKKEKKKMGLNRNRNTESNVCLYLGDFIPLENI